MGKFTRTKTKGIVSMTEKFIIPPKQICLSEISKNDFCLAPSKYSRFVVPKDKKSLFFNKLDKITSLSTERKKIKKEKNYTYIEIGDINVYTGDIDYKQTLGFYVPQSNPLLLKENDIIISKVRTYRKGIGFITRENCVCTPAFLVIREVDNDLTKEYLYAILRSDFFIEQILAFQNRGMYPRLDNNTTKEVYIPKPGDSTVVSYITKIVKSILVNQEKLKENFAKINEMIEKELIDNNKEIRSQINNPTYREIIKNSRIDTGIYNQEYKKIISLIENYTEGFFKIPKEKFKSGSTPKKRIIGKGNKNWITPTIISKFGTVVKDEKIICERNNLTKDSALIVNRTSKEGIGEYVGITMFYDFEEKGFGHHSQGCYRLEDFSKEELVYITALLNSKFYRKICGNVSMGSKMKEIKISDFSNIPFPKLKNNIKTRIIDLYISDTGILKLSNNIISKEIMLEEIVTKIINEESFKFD